MTQPSDKYFEALRLSRKHHDNQNKTFSGRFTWKNRHRIKELIDRFDVKSILDYGCGKGKQYIEIDPDTGQTLEQYWGVTATKYDPGTKEYVQEPVGKFDMVICVQVLGSIPRIDLPWVIDRLYSRANKVIFVSERLVTPRKQIYASIAKDMPFGMSREEWLEMLRRPVGHTQPWPAMFVGFKSAGVGWAVEEVNTTKETTQEALEEVSTVAVEEISPVDETNIAVKGVDSSTPNPQ